jgi:hypothetical protein
LQALALQCLALMSEIEPKYTVAYVEEAFRRPARVFKLYDDLSIQHFLREVQVETLNDFLWYMKDRELIMTVVNNMSSRAAESLVQDLENANFGHRNALWMAVSTSWWTDSLRRLRANDCLRGRNPRHYAETSVNFSSQSGHGEKEPILSWQVLDQIWNGHGIVTL